MVAVLGTVVVVVMMAVVVMPTVVVNIAAILVSIREMGPVEEGRLVLLAVCLAVVKVHARVQEQVPVRGIKVPVRRMDRELAPVMDKAADPVMGLALLAVLPLPLHLNPERILF